MFKTTFVPNSLQFVKAPAPEGWAAASEGKFCGAAFYKPPVGLLDGRGRSSACLLRAPDGFRETTWLFILAQLTAGCLFFTVLPL